ncbi:hypothetical protein AWB94_26530 [Mycolicibacterium canariasense]|nr:hypothetical protein AWB94_26530 [Mycolicibacterium canariasense]
MLPQPEPKTSPYLTGMKHPLPQRIIPLTRPAPVMIPELVMVPGSRIIPGQWAIRRTIASTGQDSSDRSRIRRIKPQ